MAQKPKFSTILVVLVLVVLVLALGAVFNNLKITKQALMQAQHDLEIAKSEKAQLEQDLDKTRSEKQDLEARLEAMDEEVNTLKDNLEKEKAARIPLAAELSSKKKELETAQQGLDRATKEREQLVADLGKAKKDYESTQEVLSQVRKAKEDLEKMVKEMMPKKDQPVELGQIVVQPAASEPKSKVPASFGASRLAGQVLTVNPEFSFVVISVGRKDGLIPGTTFDVTRDGKSIGKLQVEKIYDRMAAANIISESKKGIIKKGDQVSQI